MIMVKYLESESNDTIRSPFIFFEFQDVFMKYLQTTHLLKSPKSYGLGLSVFILQAYTMQ
tara:strand:- start:38428 stop:38607 length:180 start_codon:yes stop_codon:yes gene_type:complete